MSNFIVTSEFSREILESIINEAIAYKKGEREGKPLDGKSIALVFFNPSLRTRASMQVAIYELGGNTVFLEPGNTSWTLEHREGVIMDGGKTEHLKEFVRVIERYVSAIGVRTFSALDDWHSERMEPVISAFVKYATKPIINLESAMHHPCQSMADMMTIRERFGNEKKRVLLTWAWHPKALPMAVPNSFALAASQFGHDLRIAHPKGFALDEELIAEIRTNAEKQGGSLEITNDSGEAYEGVDVVYAKSWGSKDFYGDAEGEALFRRDLRQQWIVNEDNMAKSNEAVFMHCLPVRRNVIVSDQVIDSKNSLVIDEAENRLHVQKAILDRIVK